MLSLKEPEQVNHEPPNLWAADLAVGHPHRSSGLRRGPIEQPDPLARPAERVDHP